MSKNTNEETKKKTWLNKKIEPIIENLKPDIQEGIDQLFEKARSNIEELLDSRVPDITENIREEIERLIDHKIDALQKILSKIGLVIFACILPLTLGIWFLAFVLLMK